MIVNDTHTWREIQSQPEAWTAALAVFQAHADQLRALASDGGYDSLIFTGCGSTYYLSLSAAALLQELSGISARGLPASEIWLGARAALPARQRALLVAVSRSGATTETLRAVESWRASGSGAVLTLSCYADSPLASMGDINLVFPSGQEHSIVQTRAFTTLYLACSALAALWAGRSDLIEQLAQLPERGRHVLSVYAGLARQLGHDESWQRIFLLGSGARYGLACELSLKMKEVSLSESEPFHFMEFRHGPQSMADTGTLILGLLSEDNRRHEAAVLDDMRTRGARVIALADRDADVVFGAAGDATARNTLYLPFGQMLAYERAMWRGLDPDHPHNLDAVVKLVG